MALAQLVSLLLPALLDKVTSALSDVAVSSLSSLSSLFSSPDLPKLTRTLHRIDALLSDADLTRFSDPSSSRLLLSHLRSLSLDSHDLLDLVHTQTSSSTRKRKRCNLLDSLTLRLSISSSISDLLSRYDHIADDYNKLHIRRRLHIQEDGGEVENQSSGSRTEVAVLGFDEEKLKIKQEILSGAAEGVSVLRVVCIYGVGGVGKTALARTVYDDVEVVGCFAMRVWVGVSRDSDVKTVLKGIVESVTGEGCSDLGSLELLQRKVHQLVSGRRFLLVLDGVWNERQSFWEALRGPLMGGGEGCRVLVTTRSELVARNMRHSFLVTGLGEEDCWLLFRSYAFEPGGWDQYPDLAEIGRDIARKCQGSPLAAKSIGRLLYLNTDEEEWRSMLSDMPDSEVDNDVVLETLMVSYDHLPLCLKQCFTFCAVFPSGYQFDRDELVRIWIAVGFVEPKGSRSLENIAGRYFNHLLWRSFFQVADSSSSRKPSRKYIMPGVIHELAQSVSSNECFRIENDQDNSDARYALLTIDQVVGSLHKINKSEKLRALMIFAENGIPSKMVPNDLFLKLRYLRVLDLSNNEVVVLPDSIGDLVHLRYINLQSTKIERLPESVSNLCNLQTLELGDCDKLKELPKGTSNLINLRHLGLHLDWDKYRNLPTCLISMPPGIGKLTSLRTLSRFSVSSASGSGIEELKDLNLHGELCILNLENINDVKYVKEANLKSKRYVDTMMLRWSDGSRGGLQEEVIAQLHPHTKLKVLCVENYNGKRFPDWMHDPSFVNLETLRLSNCRKCEDLPMLGKLPTLKNLFIEGLHQVKRMDPTNLSITGGQGFSLLNMLSLSDMPNLEKWFEAAEVHMTCLTKLIISHCPKLSELPSLPISLQEIEIRNCKQLSALPMLPSLRDLVVAGVKGEMIRSIRLLNSLKSLTISQLAQLKSLPKNYLQCLSLLKHLKIEGCNKLVSVADNGGLRDLSSLETLEVSSCPQLIYLAEEGLPSTLKEFRIRFCDRIKSLPRGLHLVSSLKFMEIHSVPMLASLPDEGLPSQLSSLIIDGCPMLQQRCRRYGADWFKIQNIPYLEIGSS